MISEVERAEVSAAAAFMDQVKPDWWQNINPLSLDLTESSDCICGQNGLKWIEMCYDSVFSNRPHGGSFPRVTASNEYVEAWLNEIAERMPVRELIPA